MGAGYDGDGYFSETSEPRCVLVLPAPDPQGPWIPCVMSHLALASFTERSSFSTVTRVRPRRCRPPSSSGHGTDRASYSGTQRGKYVCRWGASPTSAIALLRRNGERLELHDSWLWRLTCFSLESLRPRSHQPAAALCCACAEESILPLEQ